MKVSGSGQKVVVLDCGPHGARVCDVLGTVAPAATIDYRVTGTAQGLIDSDAVKRELADIADHPSGICAVNMSFQFGEYVGETPPKVAVLDELLYEVRMADILPVASAGNYWNGVMGSTYPGCSPFSFPVMGNSSGVNRTERGVIGQAASSSLAAAWISGNVALLAQAGVNRPADVVELMLLMADQKFDVISQRFYPLVDQAKLLARVGATLLKDVEQADEPNNANQLKSFADRRSVSGELDWLGDVDCFWWIPLASGDVTIDVQPSNLTIRRYNHDGTFRTRQGQLTTAVHAGSTKTIGITGGIGSYTVRLRRKL